MNWNDFTSISISGIPVIQIADISGNVMWSLSGASDGWSTDPSGFTWGLSSNLLKVSNTDIAGAEGIYTWDSVNSQYTYNNFGIEYVNGGGWYKLYNFNTGDNWSSDNLIGTNEWGTSPYLHIITVAWKLSGAEPEPSGDDGSTWTTDPTNFVWGSSANKLRVTNTNIGSAEGTYTWRSVDDAYCQPNNLDFGITYDNGTYTLHNWDVGESYSSNTLLGTHSWRRTDCYC